MTRQTAQPSATRSARRGGETQPVPPQQSPHPSLGPHGPQSAQAPHAAHVPLALSSRDDRLLRAIYTYQFVSVQQLTRLFYHPGSLKYVRRRLKALSDAGYVQRLRLPSVTSGNTSYVYTLARKGITYLTAAGYSEFGRFRPSEQRAHAYLFLTHTLAVNDFLIAAQLLERVVPAVKLVDMRHERMLRHSPVKVVTPKRETITIVPDGWLDFHVGGRQRMSILLELDRGTVEQRAFKRKLRGLVAYALGPYQTLFGSRSLTIAFATTAGAHRLQLLRSWSEQALQEVELAEDADILLFTALPAGDWDPKTLFCAPMWYQPFQVTATALLEWDTSV